MSLWRSIQNAVHRCAFLVVHRPTNLMCRVVRWDQEDELLLLKPVKFPPSSSGGASSKRSSDIRRKSVGTRWAFQKNVVLVERTRPSKATAAAPAPAVAAAAFRSVVDESSATSASSNKRTDTDTPNDRVPPDGVPGAKRMPSPAAEYDLTSYARRLSKLDKRVEVRMDPSHLERGRGLFAVRDVPEGTEVMRVRAAGAILPMRTRQLSCCRCFLPLKNGERPKACRRCDVRFCARCVPVAEKDEIHRGTCAFSKSAIELCAVERGVDEGLLLLSCNILRRRAIGVIDDEEWDVFNSLESDDNEAGTIGLASHALRLCVRLFKDVMDVDVSEEDVQTIYRRVSRNMHRVSPDSAPGFGDVHALFPCGALVNHSCEPNSFFHCVSGSSADVPVLEHVLRTIRDVRAGDELCCSYLVDISTASVSERRDWLDGWGFRCACARCLVEAEEENCPVEDRKGGSERVSLMLGRVKEAFDRVARDGTLEMRKSTQHSELVEEAVTILGTDGEVVSPRLYRRLVMATFELAMAVVVPDELLLFTVLMRAGDVLSRLRDPCAITVRRRQCEEAIKLLHADKYPRAKFLAESAHTALFEAVAMSNTFYGEQHEQSVGLQRDYLSLVRQVKRAR